VGAIILAVPDVPCVLLFAAEEQDMPLARFAKLHLSLGLPACFTAEDRGATL
jgi:hypothetical protein